MFIIICSLGVTYAGEIKNIINEFIITHHEEKHSTTIETNAVVNLNGDDDIPEKEFENYNEKNDDFEDRLYSFSKLEQLLGIRILKSEYYKNDVLYQYVTNKINNKISYAMFGIENFTKSDVHDKQLQMSFTLITKNASDEEKEKLRYQISGAYREEEYFIDNLNTTAYIIKPYQDHNESRRYQIILDYDNIRYDFNLYFYQRTLDEAEQEVRNLLESLKY